MLVLRTEIQDQGVAGLHKHMTQYTSTTDAI
jgi:hypothetical protein